MKIGKLSNKQLKSIILDRLSDPADFVRSGPAIGVDCSILDYGDGQIAVSTDPITGASSNIGRLAVTVASNDIAACGIRPAALLMTIIAPPSASVEDLTQVVDQAVKAADLIKVSIVGGHTEVSDAVNRFVISSTVIGYAQNCPIVLASGGMDMDYLVMTKTAGLEGTAILASDFRQKLSAVLSGKQLDSAEGFLNQISVAAEGEIGGNLFVHAMHDATEGGILGACWELAQASHLGCQIDLKSIPVDPLTTVICNHLGLDAYRLISSGSMIMATDDPDQLIQSLKKAEILGTIIGRLTKNNQRELIDGDESMELPPPGPDELYKIQ